MLKEHEPPADTLEPQLCVTEKFLEAVILVKIISALPEFCKVTACVALVVVILWFAKTTESITPNEICAVVPVPVRLIEFGLEDALLAMLMVPVLLPAVVGLKPMVNEHKLPTARFVPQS